MSPEDYEKLEKMFLGKIPRDREFEQKTTEEGIARGEKPGVKSYPGETRRTAEELERLNREFDARMFGPRLDLQKPINAT